MNNFDIFTSCPNDIIIYISVRNTFYDSHLNVEYEETKLNVGNYNDVVSEHYFIIYEAGVKLAFGFTIT